MKDQNKTKPQLLTQVAELSQRVEELEAQVARHSQVEQELRRLKDFHASIAHNIAEGVVAKDAAGYFTFVNPAAATLLGYAPAELVGRHWTSIIPLDQQPIVQAADDRCVPGQADHYEVEMVRKDGRRVPVLVSGSPQFAADGHFVESLIVFTNTAARKQAEAARQESEVRYRRLFEDAVLSIFQSTPDGRVIAVNPAFARMFGYESPEEVASTVKNVATDIFADPQRRAEIARLIMEQPDLRSFENLYRRKDGSVFTGALHVWPVKDAEGQLLQLEGSIEDITERKRTAEYIAKLNYLKQQLIGTSSLNEKIKFITDGVVEIFGADFSRIWITKEADLCDKGCRHAAVTEGPHVCRNRTRCLHLVASSGRYTHIDGGHGRVPLGSYKIGRVASGEDPQFITNDVSNDPRVHDHEWARSLGLVSFAGYRLLATDGKPIGVLALFSQRAIVPDEEKLLEDLANTTSQVILAGVAEEALRRYADEQAALYKTSLRLNAQLDLSELPSLILDQAVELLGAEAGCLYLYDPQRDKLTVSVGVGFMREFVGMILKPGEGLAGQAFASRRPQLVDNHNAWPGQAAVYKGDAQLKATLAVPLWGRKGILGVLIIGSGEQKLTFEEHDLELAELFAMQAGVALENVSLHAETQRRARELAALNRATLALTSTLNLKSVLELMITEARALVDAEGASVVLLSDSELVFAAATGPGAEQLVGVKMSITAGIAGWVVREGRAVRVNDVRSDPRFYAGIDNVTSLTTRSVLAVPLRVKGAVTGVIEAVNKVSLSGATGPVGLFGEHDLEMLQMMADSAAIAIENARLYEVEQKQFKRLQESQSQLIQSAKMAALGRLVASITHEINNPLQAIQNSLTLAQEEMEGGPRPEKMTRYLGMAETEIERLANIVRRLRDFYRPTRQERQLTDVRVVLEGVLELTGKQLQHSHITIEREDLAGVELPLIWANADHLKQVFLNLVLNAMDAMSARGGTLRVRMALDTLQPRDGPPRPAVRIEFSDTGEGIPPEIMSHLFEPFITTKPDGTGLGLSISYGIIEAHNGQITAASRSGEGTTFTILLPVEEAPVVSQSPQR
jgi:two-component system, NtrC family, sensor kinase